MMSKTGNRGLAPEQPGNLHRKIPAVSGFTFLEVMAASAALALGAVMIYDAFFISLDTFNYYRDYLNVASWVDNKVWEAQAEIRQGGPVNPQEDGEFTQNNKKFRWNLGCNLIDAKTGLYAINIFLSWKTGKRETVLSRGTYEILPQS